MTTTNSFRSSSLMHLDTEARAARNLRTRESRAIVRQRIAELKAAGCSTWELAKVSQLAPSTIRGIRAASRAAEQAEAVAR